MDPTLWFAGYFAVGMFVAAMNSKALGVSIVYAVSLLATYPDPGKAGLCVILYIPAVLLASFRD